MKWWPENWFTPKEQQTRFYKFSVSVWIATECILALLLILYALE